MTKMTTEISQTGYFAKKIFKLMDHSLRPTGRMPLLFCTLGIFMHQGYRMQSEQNQGCALAEPGGPWRLTFAYGRLDYLRFFMQIICWAPYISQFQSTGLPSIFLRAQP